MIEKPFSIYPDNFDLSAYKKVTARLDFDPTFNTSKRSCIEKRQLKVKHSKHPFVEAIDVVGIFNFPNLELETQVGSGQCCPRRRILNRGSAVVCCPGLVAPGHIFVA